MTKKEISNIGQINNNLIMATNGLFAIEKEIGKTNPEVLKLAINAVIDKITETKGNIEKELQKLFDKIPD